MWSIKFRYFCVPYSTEISFHHVIHINAVMAVVIVLVNDVFLVAALTGIVCNDNSATGSFLRKANHGMGVV